MFHMRAKLMQAIALLQQVIAELDDQTPTMPQESLRRIADGLCLNCGLPIAGKKENRGCHDKCYHRVRRRIAEGKLSEFEAVSLGLLAPKSPSGRKPKSDDQLSEILDAKLVAKPLDDPTPAEVLENARRKKKRSE